MWDARAIRDGTRKVSTRIPRALRNVKLARSPRDRKCWRAPTLALLMRGAVLGFGTNMTNVPSDPQITNFGTYQAFYTVEQ